MIRPRTLQGRLALAFGATTVALVGVVGVVIARVTAAELVAAVDESLATRLSDLDSQLSRLSPLQRRGLEPLSPSGDPVGSPGGVFAQVLDEGGDVRAAQPAAAMDAAVLTPAELARARRERFTLERRLVPATAEARLLAGPSGVEPGWVLVAGTSMDEAERAQDRLRLALALGLPVLAGAVAAGGWVLAGAALGPVRRMVDEADAISASEPDRRLTVPERAGAEIVVLARRLNALLDRVERALHRERSFVDDASHELRTPLAIARGELELARMATPDGSPSAEAVESSLEEVQRLERLAQNLLVLARVGGRSGAGGAGGGGAGRGGGGGRGELVDVAAVAARAARAAASTASTTSTTSTASTAGTAGSAVAVTVEGAGTVRGDATELERALGNLVDNAVRHARSRVWARVTEQGGDVVVDVVDDGPGFAPDLLPVAFDRFTAGPGGGAGLGLAIVAAIATAHGGEATAGNGSAGGAWVRLRLPAGER